MVAERVRDTLDGHNVESALLELGLRLHRTILDHLMKFEYSATGMVLVFVLVVVMIVTFVVVVLFLWL